MALIYSTFQNLRTHCCWHSSRSNKLQSFSFIFFLFVKSLMLILDKSLSFQQLWKLSKLKLKKEYFKLVYAALNKNYTIAKYV